MTDENTIVEPTNCRGKYIPPNGKNDVNYIFALVDLVNAEDVENSFELDSSSTSQISFSFEYQNDPTIANNKTYCLPIYLDQNYVKGNPGPKMQLLVENRKPPTKSTSGTIEPVRGTGLGLEHHDQDSVRFMIIRSKTFTDQYFVFIYVKTVATNTRNLQVNTNGKKIEISYEEREGGSNTESTYVVAVAAVDSTKDQFTSIVLTDDSENEHTTKFPSDAYTSADKY